MSNNFSTDNSSARRGPQPVDTAMAQIEDVTAVGALEDGRQIVAELRPFDGPPATVCMPPAIAEKLIASLQAACAQAAAIRSGQNPSSLPGQLQWGTNAEEIREVRFLGKEDGSSARLVLHTVGGIPRTIDLAAPVLHQFAREAKRLDEQLARRRQRGR